MRKTKITIPASTSNLGASFDTCGLALGLYLRVTVEGAGEGFEIIPSGEGSDKVPRDESNLICRVARFLAERRGRKIDGARLWVDSEIPLARGLGSSSSAIIAGISVYEVLAGERLDNDQVLRYALNFEEHGDNLAPSLLGGLVVACVVGGEDGERSTITVKRAWPEQVKIVLVIPDFELETSKMRAVLPASVSRADAVFNVQRAALLQAALAEGRFDLLSEALRDRLHQPHRAPLGPGLGEVLKLNEKTGDHPGLLGVAMSGAGPTMVAFATGHSEEIGEEMKRRLEAEGVSSRAFEVSVDDRGRVIQD
ncbi:MAG TPA: homoserine kinase [Blastocatellia bacterium]|nr:homoserine kinase [Blastocatellia bacterium]